MKLLYAIVQNDDVKPLTRALIESEISVTRISSSGGFLSGGNSTLMIGIDAGRLQEALDIIKLKSKRRKTMMATPAYLTSHGMDSVPLPVEISVGGATVFVVDVDQYYKF